MSSAPSYSFFSIPLPQNNIKPKLDIATGEFLPAIKNTTDFYSLVNLSKKTPA